jgi:branched-chain amino acid transport system ATP-binding protein
VAEALLALEGVHTHIGRYHILQGVDLRVPEGGVTMLLGRNGVGKSTTLRTIMGFWRASQGRVRFAESEITARPTSDIARLGIAYVPEEMGIFGNLSVRENLLLAARSGEPDDTRLRWVFGLFPALEQFWRKNAGTLSGGQKQMLAIARAIVEPRRLIVVDEPSKGLAPAIVDHLADAFRELKAARTTLLMVEQNIRLARAVGDSVAVMADGRIVHTGAMAELAADEALQTRLLGLSLEQHQ